MGDFFVSKNDVELVNNILAQSADLWIKSENSKGSGVIDATTPSATTLTDTTQTWTDDELVGLTLIIDGKEYVITDNDATSVTFDSTSEPINNGTYSYRIMNIPEYMGYSEDVKLSVSDDTLPFYDGIPAKKIIEVLLKRNVEGSGVLRVLSKGIWKAIFDGKEVDTGTETIIKVGSNPGSKPNYELMFKTRNYGNKQVVIRMYQVQLSVDGEINFSGDNYKVIPVKFNVNADSLRDDPTSDLQEGNYLEIRIEK